MVAASQPYLTMKFVMDYVNKGHLSCETIDGGNCKSVATDMCTYMNSCNSHGSCSEKTDGKCVCDDGYYGADCASEVDKLIADKTHYTYIKSATGYRWFYFSLPTTGDYSVSVNSDSAVSVYISKGTTNLPDPVNFDTLIKNEMTVQITQESLDLSKGAILAVYCTGDETDVTKFTITLTSTTSSFLNFFQ